MTKEDSIHVAARIWCDPKMKHREMNPELAEKIADLLHKEYGLNLSKLPGLKPFRITIEAEPDGFDMGKVDRHNFLGGQIASYSFSRELPWMGNGTIELRLEFPR